MKKIITNKIFLTLLSFLVTTITLKLFGDIGWIFMLYPCYIVIMGIIYGFIINPLRDHRNTQKYLSHNGVLEGRITYNGEPLKYIKVGVGQPSNTQEDNRFDLSNYHTSTDVNGYFRIPHIYNGNFKCVALLDGNKRFESDFTISDANNKVILNIQAEK
jgi:hypothetical protein